MQIPRVITSHKNNIAIFIIGIIIGVVLFYVFCRYYYYKDVIEKKSCVKLVSSSSSSSNNPLVIHNCVNRDEMIASSSATTDDDYKKKKKLSLETPSSYILQIDDSKITTDYYEVSVLDEKDNLLWVKNNVSQIDLSNFSSKKVKYKIFTPSEEKKAIPHNIYKVPKLTQTFNPVSLNSKKLKFYSSTEIDYQEALVDKILEDSHFTVKKEIKGTELKTFEGVLSRCSVLFVSEVDFIDIKTKNTYKSFLIYPSNGILTDIQNIVFKEDFHESFGIKITEIILTDEGGTASLKCIFPLISLSSCLPVLKLVLL